MKTWLIIWVFMLGAATGEECIVRDFGSSSTACVCNATYCDFLEPIADSDISGGSFLHYATTKAGLRLKRTSGKFASKTVSDNTTEASFTVVRNTTYQEIFGFGGALTDSTALNIMNLSEKATDNLMRSYFGKGGSQYGFLRMPMGACDFSITYYSYAEVKDDVELKSFGLADIDYKIKIPILKKAAKLKGQEIKLFTVPWAAPWWMLINSTRIYLNETYYQTFANYFVKYLDAYGKEGVHFWGLNPENEPTHGYAAKKWIPAMAFTEEQMIKWVGDYLGPTLEKAGYGHLKLMLFDDNRHYFLDYVLKIIADEAVHNYSSGVALHWYSDNPNNAWQLTYFHDRYPDQFLFYTEASVIMRMTVNDIGNWDHAERYINSMFQAFNNWVSGWADWNMALNEEGGPMRNSDILTHYGFPAAVHVNSTADEFYKQPSYYVQAHFSSLVPPGSRRVQLDSEDAAGLLNVAFLTPQDSIVVVLGNTGETAITTSISEESKGSITVEVGPKSIHTILYK